MKDSLVTVGVWLRRRAEDVAVGLLAVMFVAFLVQIVFRYLLNFPIGWTSELTIITWLWVVLWGAAFVVKENEEVRFDLLYAAVGRRKRRIMGVVTAIAILVLYGGSLPASADYVQFMKVEKTAYLKIRFDWLYSIYVIFAIAIIVRYASLLWHLLRGRVLDEAEVTTIGSGL